MDTIDELLNFPGMTIYIVVIAFTTVTYFVWKRQFGNTVVNCWFCNTDSTVTYHCANSWTCQHCHQYNGFTSAGDYNEKIPEMHDESMNVGRITRDVNDKTTTFIQQNTKLCAKCTRNQLLKIKQLSQFEPIDEGNYEYEAGEFKKKLEKLYSLCLRCEKASDQHIKMQDSVIRKNIKTLKPSSCVSEKTLFATETHQFSSTKSCAKNGIAIGFWFVILILSMLFFWLETCQIFNEFHLSRAINFGMFPNNKDFKGFIMVSGCILSLSTLSLNGVPRNKISKLCIGLWILCICRTLVGSQQVYTLEWLNNYTMEVIKNISNIENMKIFSAYSLGVTILQLVVSFLLVGTSGFSFHLVCTAEVQPPTTVYAKKAFSNKRIPKQPSSSSPQISSNLDASIYSDCSMPSDDETKPPGVNLRHFNDKVLKSSPCLNSSLNALNLQDNAEQNFKQFKRPGPLMSNNLLSALHTPPPSRSSSLLSLSSQQSLSLSNTVESNRPINKFGSTADFANPSSEIPFYRYKANTTVGGWTHNQTCNYSKFSAPSSTVSFPFSRGNKLSHQSGSLSLDDSRSINKNTKPLISPARLQLSAREQQMRDRLRNEWFESNGYDHDPAENAWEQKSVPDISIHDSVSQVGEQHFPELSDDDDIFKSPQHSTKRFNMNSSPGSSISRLTSKSVERIENSRVCRWFLAICVLANVVLLMLLTNEVKGMREMEQWKSKATL